MMDNLENVIVTFQKALLVMLEKIEELELLKKSPGNHTESDVRKPDSTDMQQLTNDAITSTEMPMRALISETEMKQKRSHLKIRFALGLVTLAVGFIAANLALFHWLERTGLHYLLGDYARYVCAYGGFAAMILGALMTNDFLILNRTSKEEYRPDNETTMCDEAEAVVGRGHRNKRQAIAAIPFAILLLMICPMVVSSAVSYTATVVIAPHKGTGVPNDVYVDSSIATEGQLVEVESSQSLGAPEKATVLDLAYKLDFLEDKGKETTRLKRWEILE